VFPSKERAGAIAAWSAVAGVGIVVGPTLGGALLDEFSWGSVFLVNVPLVAAAVILVRASVPEMAALRAGGAGGRRSFDPIGALLSVAGLVALVDAVIEAPVRGWLAATTLAEAAGALVVLGAFVAWELRSTHPMMDVRIFAHRAFSAASASVTLTFFTLFGSLFALTQYLQLVHGYSPLSAGLRALPFAVGMGVTSAVSSRLALRFGPRAVVPSGLVLMAFGLWRLAGVAPETAYVHVMWAVLIMGVGMGLVMAPASESIMSTLPPAQAGVGSAVNDTVREIGGSLGVAVVGSLVSAAYRSHVVVTGLPAGAASAVRGSIAAADRVAAGAGASGPAIAAHAHQAFTSAMGTGFHVAAAVGLAGALVVAVALPGRTRERTGTVPAEVVSPDEVPSAA
ncbi:MAG TPA: MFS transporter, partial [Acidimicrobiales bacterium]|nr:MFS transporter [Acidimicrobiales bacterium]